MLGIKNGIKEYTNDEGTLYALDDVSLTFPDIQFASILGPSGCGKTTLLNMLGCLDELTSGEVLSDGKNILELSEKEKNFYRNNKVGFIFQNYYLIANLNVLDNVKLALSIRDIDDYEASELAKDALNRVGASSFIHKKVKDLSGGQKQRVAIARALVTSPSYILADEPTGALDSESSTEIMNILKEISKERLVIMVTHNEQLANQYSDRIIRMSDGKIVEDKIKNNLNVKVVKDEDEYVSKLSFFTTMKMALKNLFSKKVKTILTAIGNSFGVIGIAFLLAVNNGFDSYSTNLSRSTATSLPIVIPTYNKNTTSESYAEKNASVAYTDEEEIYPIVDLASQYSYSYNGFSSNYTNFLDSLVEEGIVIEYITSYSNSYSYNLMTKFPKAISQDSDEYIASVNTSSTNYNYYAYNANLPYNIFHVLYGDMSQYDLLCGELPTEKEDLVLVVDKYNSISFNILKGLGFYNSNDTQADVEDSNLESKVKPISFETVLNKEYKIFLNDDYYINPVEEIVTDANGQKRTITTYETPSITEDFYNSGMTLKIKGIIRPKQNSPFSILSSSLCYSQALQNYMMPLNTNSKVANTIKNNIVFNPRNNSTNPLEDFMNELGDFFDEFLESDSSVMSTSELNNIFNKYFIYYPIVSSNYVYVGFSTFFNIAKCIGAELITDSVKGVDLSNEDELNKLYDRLEFDLKADYNQAYIDLISLISYANAYSTIQCIVVFPKDLTTRDIVLQRLDEYNNLESTSSYHAKNEKEFVSYAKSDVNYLVQDVAEMISLVSIILIIFAVVSSVVSSLMTSVVISNNVLERKKEIGLLRSLGARKKDVLLLFEIESLITGLFSGIVGAVATHFLCIPLNNAINAMLTSYSVNNICNFTFTHAIIVIIFSIIVSFISALIPAYRASKVTPVESLRSE